MFKLLTILVLAISVTSCGWFDRKIVANLTGSSEVCVSGVAYLQFPSGASVKYNRDGKVVSC